MTRATDDRTRRIRYLRVAQVFAEQQPLGRRGREATKGFIIPDQLQPDRRMGAICEMKVFGPIESAWRGYLSLRDPAGASHAAGPPKSALPSLGWGIPAQKNIKIGSSRGNGGYLPL